MTVCRCFDFDAVSRESGWPLEVVSSPEFRYYEVQGKRRGRVLIVLKPAAPELHLSNCEGWTTRDLVEAGKVLLPFVARDLRAARITACIALTNPYARSLACACGFKRVGQGDQWGHFEWLIQSQ